MSELQALDGRQLALAESVGSGLSIPEAAERCGYSVSGAYQALDTPLLAAVVVKRLARRIILDGAPAAVAYLVRLVKDEEASGKLRLEAAKALLDRAGFVAPKAADPERPGDKGLHDMSADQLKEFIGKAQNELANRATIVEGETVDAPATGQDADLFD